MKHEPSLTRMKTISTTLLLAALAAAPAGAQQRFQQKAYLIMSAGDVRTVWISDANENEFLYYATERGVVSERMRIIEPQSIWLFEPPDFTVALEYLQGREFEKAIESFGKVAAEYEKLRELPNNFASRSLFLEMEALRKLGRYPELVGKMEAFGETDRKSLIRDHELQQLEFNQLYEAMVDEDWPRLEKMAADFLGEALPSPQKVQAAYALALAQEKQGRPMEALESYNLVMVTDPAFSEPLVGEAVLGAIRVIRSLPEVAAELREGGDPDPESEAYGLLVEGGALATLYRDFVAGEAGLPPDAAALLPYAADAGGGE